MEVRAAKTSDRLYDPILAPTPMGGRRFRDVAFGRIKHVPRRFWVHNAGEEHMQNALALAESAKSPAIEGVSET